MEVEQGMPEVEDLVVDWHAPPAVPLSNRWTKEWRERNAGQMKLEIRLLATLFGGFLIVLIELFLRFLYNIVVGPYFPEGYLEDFIFPNYVENPLSIIFLILLPFLQTFSLSYLWQVWNTSRRTNYFSDIQKGIHLGSMLWMGGALPAIGISYLTFRLPEELVVMTIISSLLSCIVGCCIIALVDSYYSHNPKDLYRTKLRTKMKQNASKRRRKVVDRKNTSH